MFCIKDRTFLSWLFVGVEYAFDSKFLQLNYLFIKFFYILFIIILTHFWYTFYPRVAVLIMHCGVKYKKY